MNVYGALNGGTKMGKLDDKVALITGGSSGIGEATVRLFVKEGACVVFTTYTQEEKSRRMVEELGSNTRYLHADVGQETDVKSAINLTVETFGRLDCLFNNAGYPPVKGPIESMSVEAFDQGIGVLLRGVFLGMKYAAPVMKRQGTGSIINNSSVAGFRIGFSSHIYHAAKAAVNHLTRSVAMELGESGVRVNCICPGAILTSMFGRGFGLSAEAADNKIELLKPLFTEFQSIKRPGLPEDIAQAALWLASEDSGFVNGHALVVDGGFSVGSKWSDRGSFIDQLQSTMDIDT